MYNRSPTRARATVEIHAALKSGKELVFKCVKYQKRADGSVTVSTGDKAAVFMLQNFSNMVNVREAESAVEEDKRRELATIGDTAAVDKAVAQALIAGVVAIGLDSKKSVVDVLALGEPGALAAALPKAKADFALNAACAAGLADGVRDILGRGVGTRLQDDYFPLWISCAHGHAEVVAVLLAAGANVDSSRLGSLLTLTRGYLVRSVDHLRRTPLYIACTNGHAKIVAMLIAAGANVDLASNDDGRTPLWVACQNGHVDIAARLLDNKADVDRADWGGRTPLFFACQNGRLDVTALLLDHKADVDRADKFGKTPLFEASYNGHANVVKALIGAKADLNKANGPLCIGDTPLRTAELRGNTEVAALLHAAGAKEPSSRCFACCWRTTILVFGTLLCIILIV